MPNKPPLYPHVPKSRQPSSRRERSNAWRCKECGWTVWNVLRCPKCGSYNLEELSIEEVLAAEKTGHPVIHRQEPYYERIEEVPRSAVGRELASRKEEAIGLLKQAVNEVESDNFESALWRAVDAAGLMSFFVHRDAIGMPPSPTGRGFFICKK